MTATHWTTANLRDRSGIVKQRRMKEQARGQRWENAAEKDYL